MTLSHRIVYTCIIATTHDKEHHSTMFFSKKRRPPVDQPLPVAPVFTEPIEKWFEVVLCERGPDGEVIVKDHQKSIEPQYTFHEGLHPDKYYAMAIRRVESRDGTVFTGDWTDLTEWRKPNRSHELV